jgi:hypothetical protein
MTRQTFNIRHNKTRNQTYTRKKYMKKHKSGWLIVDIHGTPQEIGYQHGWTLAAEIVKCIQKLKYYVQSKLKTPYDKYVHDCVKSMKSIIENDYGDIYTEMVYIAQGVNDRLFSSSENQHKISFEDILAWNALLSMESMYGDDKTSQEEQRCSAFIATGSATEDGQIVMTHNTHCPLLFGSVSNVIMKIRPEKGYAFTMQTCAGLVCSSMDWFLCSSGIIGCETTISQIKEQPVFGAPYFCRIRTCMQYADSLDKYSQIMSTNNAGDYSCSWLFGDIRNNEIMLCEIGHKNIHVEKKKDGVFIGTNLAISDRIRLLETDIQDNKDTQLSTNARKERLEYLLLDKYSGKINISNSKKIIADHYDSYLGKITPSSRTICKHGENDYDGIRELSGAVDGKVVNSNMAKKMHFWGRFGSSCGRVFKVKSFIKNTHADKNNYPFKYLDDLPKEKWVLL